MKPRCILPLIEKFSLRRTCLELFESLKDLGPAPFWLDSALPKSVLSQYSYMGVDPFLTIESKGKTIHIRKNNKRLTLKGDPLDFLKRTLENFKLQGDGASPERGLPPFNGGAVGFLGYDLRYFIERLPKLHKDDLFLPDMALAFYDTLIAVEHRSHRAWLISWGLPEKGNKAEQRAAARIKEFRQVVTRPARRGAGVVRPGKSALSCDSNLSRKAYEAMIRKAKEYIEAGDIYQVNLSQRFEGRLSSDPFLVYKKLRSENPAPFGAYLDLNGVQFLSSSPERFLKINGSSVESRPIKGTRPRGKNPAQDKRLQAELMKSAKDHAEHIMIVDLVRNDLGRVCNYGSVHVAEDAILEKYQTVSHLVSTVRGALRPGQDALACFRACFPGGSVTGAPKIRAMEIIEELEPSPRGAYTGAFGTIGFNGNWDLAMTIRTLLVRGGRFHFHAGGGIVADSDPDKEYRETWDKARGLLRALS